MTVFGQATNTDQDGVKTTAAYGDRGDGSNEWYQSARIFDGGDVTQGAKADTAVTDPSLSGSVIALLKGIITQLRAGAAALGKAEDAAHTSGDTGVMALGVRNDSRTSLAGTDLDYVPVAHGAAGNIMVTQVPSSLTGWNPSSYSAHAAASGTIKSSAGKLFVLVITNDNASPEYFMLHNNTSVPADGTAPLFALELPAKSSFELDFGSMGLYFNTGISWSLSTTFATKTLAGADGSLAGTYI